MKPELLDGVALLAELDDASRSVIADELEVLELAPDTVLFEAGDPADALLLVAEGSVRAESALHGSSAVLGPGAALGALSLVVGGARRARAETTSRCVLLRLPRSGYRRVVRAEPRVGCVLLEAIVREAARLAWDAVGPDGVAPVDPDSDGE